jgi:DNA polymerase III delta prime subunit
VFETLIPKPMMQHYISLLLKHRRLVLSGPSGTGKTYLTNRLAEYLVERSGREVTEGIVSTFNMHQQSCKVTRLLRPPPVFVQVSASPKAFPGFSPASLFPFSFLKLCLHPFPFISVLSLSSLTYLFSSSPSPASFLS